MAKQEKLRSGAVDLGRIYEQRIAAHLAIKCALDPDLSDFWIVSNVNGVEAFDDIVLMVQDQSGNRKLYCIQLKYLTNSNLQATQLENHTPKNKFSLKKYQDSFDIIERNIRGNTVDILRNISLDEIYLILWTNAPLTSRDKLQHLNTESAGGMDFLNTTTDSNVYKVSNLASSEAPFNEKFLERFYLFAKQASASSLDKIIKSELISHFDDVSNSVIISITDYFTKWSMGDSKNILRITKNDVQRTLLEFLFIPHLIEPTPTEGANPERFNLVNETLTSFNIIPIKEKKLLKNIFTYSKTALDRLYKSRLNLELPWNADLSGIHWDALKATSDQAAQKVIKILQEKKIFVPYLTIKDLYLASWRCRLIPLVVNCEISKNFVENALAKLKAVAKEFSFVLLNPTVSALRGDLKIFDSIDSIEDSQLKSRNLEEARISLQSKEKINLGNFKEKVEILQEVVPDVYLTLMEDVVVLGETIETETYYVKRDLRRPLLEVSVLDENSAIKDRDYLFNQAGDIFLLVEFEGSLPLRYANRSVELTKYVNEGDYKENEEIYIIVTSLNDLDETVTSTATRLHKETSKSVHVMKLCCNYLEWSFSKGTVETLQKHLIETNLLKEENPEYNIPEDNILTRSRSNVNIISNNAGMGKTFMLKSLATKFEPDEWICYINLSEHISKIPQENRFQSYFQQISVEALKTKDPWMQDFCTRMYLHCLQTRKIVCLFDGYDEVSSEHALLFLKEAKACGLRMWITTRPTYKKELEIHMENLSVEITHFSSEDHVTFLWKYFQSYSHSNHYNDVQIQYIIDTINKCSSNLDKTFIAVPLQTRMFAEIFGDDINQISEKEKLTIVDLYNKFVDVKLKEYKSYEATSLKRTLSKLALKLFFTEKLLENLIDFDDLAEEAVTFQESYKKDSIVIGLNEKGDAVFGHRTFAEFLAAYWLTKQIVNKKGEYNLSWLSVVEKLYYIEMVPVRVFFDRILSQNLPLHLAVLNNDKESAQTLLRVEQLKENVDALGRSPLHIAVTYGTHYDLYVAREIKGLRNVGLHSVIQLNNNAYRLRIRKDEQHLISNEIVDELLNHGFVNATDRLFRYDLFDYAMKSFSLNFVHALFKRFDKTALYFDIGYSFEMFLFCTIHDNLYNILSKRKSYDFTSPQTNRDELRDMFKGYNFKLLTLKYNDMYLTEVAALSGAKEAVFDLLQSGALSIQHGDVLHKACFGGYSDVLELLCNMGADIEQLDKSNWSPLYQAGTRKREDIIYHLLKSGKLSNVKTSSTSMTPLHYAVQGDHVECVRKLLELGAKVNVKDAYNNTPLLYACQYGYVEIIEHLLKSGQMDVSDDTVRSVINVTAFHGYSDSVKKLLDYGLDANNIDSDGNTPLVISAKKGFSNVVSELADSGRCDLNLMVNNESLASLQLWCAGNNHILLTTKFVLIQCDRKKIGGVTALHFAARHDHADCTKTLIDLGANHNIEDEVTKYTPLVWACMYGSERVLRVLLAGKYEGEDLETTANNVQLGLIWAALLGYERCVEVLCRYIEESGLKTVPNERVKGVTSREFMTDWLYLRENDNMPLLVAARNGHPKVIKTLVSFRYRNNDGLEEALHWASKSGHLECVQELILAGADENKTNEKFLRLLPITWASQYGRTAIVEYLLRNKTSAYLQNKDLHLALNWAALGGHHDCLRLLLDFGLDVENTCDQLNGTPLINACEYRGTVEVIEALMEKNCNVKAKNTNGLTALDFAAQKKNFQFVKRLVNSGAFKDERIEEESVLYENLQLALKWAVEKEELDLIEGLAGLGIIISD